MLQIFKVRHLAQAMKEGTLEKLITQILIWISSETVLKTELDDARELLKALNVLMLHILVCELNIHDMFV
jgi:cytoskeleton-associated protein 5